MCGEQTKPNQTKNEERYTRTIRVVHDDFRGLQYDNLLIMVANLKKDAPIVILNKQFSRQFQDSKTLEQVPEGLLVDSASLTVCMLDKLLFARWPEGQCIRFLSYCIRIL